MQFQLKVSVTAESLKRNWHITLLVVMFNLDVLAVNT